MTSNKWSLKKINTPSFGDKEIEDRQVLNTSRICTGKQICKFTSLIRKNTFQQIKQFNLRLPTNMHSK